MAPISRNLKFNHCVTSLYKRMPIYSEGMYETSECPHCTAETNTKAPR